MLVIAALGLVTTVAVASSQSPKTQASSPKPAAAAKTPMKVTVPPLPNVGFAPVRPMDVVRATYDFAANHPEILHYIPCFCGCGSQGHKANESCFVARRDKQGNVLEWDTHGFGCTICIDVAREAMQLYASGADVQSIRAAIERRDAAEADGRTPTPPPPAKKS
ncbi:MAG: PCYCGC motif-containing (lipo)protein [Acidobacteriota bacterium]